MYNKTGSKAPYQQKRKKTGNFSSLITNYKG